MICCETSAKVDMAKSGDADAFGELFSLYYKDLYSYAFIMLFNEEDAKDMVQNTFIKAFSAIKQLNDSKYFKTWIMKILINNCRSFKVIRFNRKHRPLSGCDMWTEAPCDDEIELMDALRVLPAKYRKIVTLRFFNDLSLKEISALLHIPEGTVKSRLSRGIESLKKIMEVEE